MCDCLNDIVETAVCVQAGALPDADGPAELKAVTAWARHDQGVDLAMARSAPVHYAVALINVPRGGPTANWLVADLERLIKVEETSGLHPAWRAYAGLWLAHMAAAVALSSDDPSVGEQALDTARKYVDAIGGVCLDSLYAPATVAELEEDPYAWIDCDGPPESVPSADELALNGQLLDLDPGVEALTPLVLGLRTMNSDDWRSWPSAALVRQLHGVW